MDGIPITEFGKYGLEGSVFAVLAWLLWQFSNRNDRIQEARVTDQKALTEIIQLNSTTMAALATASEARNRASEAQAKSMELQALAQTQLTAEVQRLRDSQTELQNRIDSLREQVLRRGGAL